MYTVLMVSTVLFSQGCVLENGSHCGHDGQNVHSKDREGGEKPLFALVQLLGQLVVMSSNRLPLRTISLIVDPFRFFLTRVSWISWICMSISLLRFGKISAIISSNRVSVPFFLSSAGIHMVHIWFHLMMTQKCLRLPFIFHHSFFLFTTLQQYFWKSCLQVHGFILLTAQVCCWVPLVNFSIQILCS